jgi:hypothetical protein
VLPLYRRRDLQVIAADGKPVTSCRRERRRAVGRDRRERAAAGRAVANVTDAIPIRPSLAVAATETASRHRLPQGLRERAGRSGAIDRPS